MSYAWSAKLETGISEVDRQHMELFEAINNLLDACAKGQGENRIGVTLDFLNDYIAVHFDKEKAMMEESGYPEIGRHLQSHEDFRRSVQAIAREYREKGASISLVAKVNSALASWLVKHIEQDDMRVAAHIRSMKMG